MEHLLCNIGNSLDSYQKILQLYDSLAQFRECGHIIRIEQWFDAKAPAIYCLQEEMSDSFPF